MKSDGAQGGRDEVRGAGEEVVARLARTTETAPCGAPFPFPPPACSDGGLPPRGPQWRIGHRRAPPRRDGSLLRGYIPAADHQRSHARQRLCAGRTRLHDGLRHHRPDQFRARRSRDDRRDGRPVGDHRAGRLARHAAGGSDHPRRPDRRDPGLRGDRLQHGKDRLPAVAPRAAARAADHGHRHVDRAAERRADGLGPQLPHVSDADPADDAQHSRRGDDRSADADRRPGGAADGRPGADRAAHAPRHGDARRRRKTRRSRA